MATKTKTEIKDYPIVEVNIDDLKPDKSNPNEMTLEQERGLEKSIVKFGRLKHIVVDQDLNVIDGAHRLEIEKANGTTKINVIQVKVKNDIDRKIIRETLNKLHGQYNKEKESSELLAIYENQGLDDLAELLAQPKQELENMITRYNPQISFEREEDDSKLPSLYDTEAFVKRGEIWKLGRHYLMCGDNQTDLEDFIKDIKVSQLNTDPPFGVMMGEKNKYLNDLGFKNRGKIEHRIEAQYDNDERNTDYYIMFNNIFNQIKFTNYNSIYLWCSDKQIFDLLHSLKDSKITMAQILTWVKNGHTMSRTDYSYKNEFIIYGWKGQHKYYGDFDYTVWEFDRPTFNNLHPTMKPIELIAKGIKNNTNENDIVLDCFAGSGSTLIACEQTQRICYGMEIDEHYCSVIIKRWENYSGLKAEKVIMS